MESSTKSKTKKVEYESGIQYIPISLIETNRFNPRQRFDQEEEDELIESILEKGILNPIIVFKKKNEEKYVIKSPTILIGTNLSSSARPEE